MVLRRKAQRRGTAAASVAAQEPATIASLGLDQLITIFSLSGNPATLSQVCKAWKAVLDQPSEVWRNVVLYGGPTAGATSSSSILQWLLRRRDCMAGVTFRRFKTLPHPDSPTFVPLFSAAVGLLTGAPLRALRFEDCHLSASLLPQLCMLSNLTALSLDSILDVSVGPVSRGQLDQMFKWLPLLEDVSMRWTLPRSDLDPWPASLSGCTRLQRLCIADLGSSSSVARTVPDSISNLAALEHLVIHGWMIVQMPSGLAQLTALRLLRLKGPLAGRQALVLPTIAALTALQRLSFVSSNVPAELTSLTSLSRLSIGGLQWTADVGTQVAGLSVLKGIHTLRLHHCSGLYKTWSGLFTLLNGLLGLKNIALDHNGITHCSLGQCARQFTAIDLRGSAFDAADGMPAALARAVNCRWLKLTFKTLTALTKGGTQPLAACPMLSMVQLEQLILYQESWSNEDVTAVLKLLQAYQDAAARRPSRQGFLNRAPTIECIAQPQHASWKMDEVESSDEEN